MYRSHECSSTNSPNGSAAEQSFETTIIEKTTAEIFTEVILSVVIFAANPDAGKCSKRPELALPDSQGRHRHELANRAPRFGVNLENQISP